MGSRILDEKFPALSTGSSNQYDTVTEKTSTVESDVLLIEDSEGNWSKKKLEISNLLAIMRSGFKRITVSSTAPTSPSVGDLWYDTT